MDKKKSTESGLELTYNLRLGVFGSFNNRQGESSFLFTPIIHPDLLVQADRVSSVSFILSSL